MKLEDAAVQPLAENNWVQKMTVEIFADVTWVQYILRMTVNEGHRDERRAISNCFDIKICIV